jgi:hypothetical protein
MSNNNTNDDIYSLPSLDSNDFTDFDFNEPTAPPDGVAYHVHNVFDNIRDNLDEITKTLGSPTMTFREFNEYFKITPKQFEIYLIEEVFKTFIVHKTPNNTQRDEYLEKVEAVIFKLYQARKNYMTDHHITSMFFWTQFVLRQPKVFQLHYFDCFLEDTFTAYDGGINMDNISCPKGIYERFLLAIADACILYCTEFKKQRKRKTRKKKQIQTEKQETRGGMKSMYNTCDKPKYVKIIRLFKKEVPDMNTLTQEWSSIFKEEEGKKMNAVQLKSHFIEFMDRSYKRYGLNNRTQIEERAKDLEYAFEAKVFG